MEYPRGKELPHSCLILSARITLPQLLISALMRVANSPGVRALRAVVGAAYFTRRYVNNVGGPPYEGAGLRIFSSYAVMDSTTCFRSVPFQFGYILENSAIFVTFANVCSHSVRAKRWPNLWPKKRSELSARLVARYPTPSLAGE